MTARRPNAPRVLGCPPHRMRADTAAAFLDLSPSTFRQRVAEGALPQAAWREGGRVYWRTADLVEAIEAAVADEPAAPAMVNSIDAIAAQRAAK